MTFRVCPKCPALQPVFNLVLWHLTYVIFEPQTFVRANPWLTPDGWHWQTVFQDSLCSTSRLYKGRKEEKRKSLWSLKFQSSSCLHPYSVSIPPHPSPSTSLTMHLTMESRLPQTRPDSGRLERWGGNHRLLHENTEELIAFPSFGLVCEWSVDPYGYIHQQALSLSKAW